LVDVIQRLILESETADAEQDLARVRKEQDKLTKEIREAGKVTDKTSDEYKRLVSDLKDLTREERDLEDQLRRTNDEFGERRRVLQANEEFGRVSQDVALAGDLESNLRTLGGAAGAAGLGGVERAIGLGAEVPAVIEALPRLQASFAGLPQTLNAAGAALGTSGTGLIGALGIGAIAIGAMALAWKKFSDDATKQAEQLSGVIEARLETQRLISTGGTVEEAQSRLEDLRANREAELIVLEELQQQYDDNIESAGLFGDALKVLSPQEQVLADQIKELKSTTQGSTAEIAQLESALRAGKFAADENADSQESVADSVKQLEATQQTAIKTERQRTSAIQESTRAQTAAVEKGFRNSAELDRIAADREASLKRQIGERRKASQDAGNERLKQEADFANKELELRKQTSDERFNLQLDNFRTIEDNIRDFDRSRKDAAAKGNFLQLEEINRADKRAAEDQMIQFARNNADITREAQQARLELNNESAQSMRELNSIVNQGLQGVQQQFQNLFASLPGGNLRSGDARRLPGLGFGAIFRNMPS
jgi:hypothetical protein